MEEGVVYIEKSINTLRAQGEIFLGFKFRILTTFFISAYTLLYSRSALTGSLSEIALYYRCYAQITNQPVNPVSNSLLSKVQAGQVSAVDACMQVLQTANLTSVAGATNQLANTKDSVAVGVLSAFHHLHYSWFYNRDFPVISWPGHAGDIKDLYDSSSPALYFTRSLFFPNAQPNSAVTGSDFLLAVRSGGSPTTGPESGHLLGDFIFSNPFSFADKGDLWGISKATSNTLNFPANPAPSPYRSAGKVDVYATQGGGFLGTTPYLILNMTDISSGQDYKADGGLLMHRRWGKAVFRDALCRDLPVVREADAQSLVTPSSSIPFRTQSSCTKCHASHDRISGLVRNMHILYVGLGDPSAPASTPANRGGNFPIFYSSAKPAESAWPISSDPDYYQRPPSGEFFYRDFSGNLIDQNFSSISELGNFLAGMDDYYICIAKRYYQYFTGINVDVGDLGDRAHPAISAADQTHRANVIKLGQDLHKSQNVQSLIRAILSLGTYRQSDFGVRLPANVTQ